MAQAGGGGGRCRACAGRGGPQGRGAGQEVRVCGRATTLAHILARFYRCTIKPDDGLPQDICLSCAHHLTMTYAFNVLVQESQQKLLEADCSTSTKCTDLSTVEYDSDSDNDVKPLIELRKTSSEEIIDLPAVNNVKSSDNSTKLYCVECRKMFYSTLKLIEHCRQLHKPKKHIGRECGQCNEKFDDFRSLIIHRKYHFSLYVCEVCWNGFDCATIFNTHSCKKESNEINETESKKSDSEKVLRQCDQCGKSYPAGYIKMHMLIHGEQRSYSCKYCPKKFKVPCGLNSHILWNHKRTRNHKCGMCNALFMSASSKSAHVRKHHLKEKKNQCETCGKKFFSKSEIHRHMLTHSGVKNFHCHMCDKSYQTRYGLNLHLKSHTHSM